MNALAVLFAAGVRLAPFHCAGVADTEVRPLLKVELRDRLLDESAPATGDFQLISIACEGDVANVLSVPQTAGEPERRRVSLVGVSPDARPRNLAVAIAELLRAAPKPEAQVASSAPAPPPQPVVQRDEEDNEDGSDRTFTAPLELAEPLILMPLTTSRRIGLRTRAGHTELIRGMESPNFYVFGLEPFLDLAFGRGFVASFTVPATWTESAAGPTVSRRGQLANVTSALRYATGDRLRVGVGAALSLSVGQAPEAQTNSNVFELDRFRDATESLRLQADVLWRADRLYLQGELAMLLLADGHQLGTLLRSGVAGGVALSRATIGVEYVVLSDALDDTFASSDHFLQSLIVGTRWTASATATLGLHVYLALDQGPNLGVAGVFSAAWTF